MNTLELELKDLKEQGRAKSPERVVAIFDGIFSMRGDFAPIDKIIAQGCNQENWRFMLRR